MEIWSPLNFNPSLELCHHVKCMMRLDVFMDTCACNKGNVPMKHVMSLNTQIQYIVVNYHFVLDEPHLVHKDIEKPNEL